MNYFFDVLKKYAVFNGRASRKEYWMFALWFSVIYVVLVAISSVIRIGFLVDIYLLATILPCLALGVRRTHDVGKSGWFMLVPVYNIILTLIKGVSGDNKYGLDPYASVAAAPVSQPSTPQA